MIDRLTDELRSLGAMLDLPVGGSVVGRVLADPRLARRPRRSWRPLAVGVAALVAVVFLVPGPRRAIASLFGLGGTTITIVDELPEAAAGARPPGEPATLEAAEAAAGFELLLLAGEPDEVLVDVDAPTPIVSLLYRDRLVITEMLSALDAVQLDKSVVAGSAIQEVLVGDTRGLWILGEHTLTYLDATGQERDLPARLVANTLLFERNGVTIRIETAGTLDDALAIAAALET